jgi:hypothetical protein
VSHWPREKVGFESRPGHHSDAVKLPLYFLVLRTNRGSASWRRAKGFEELNSSHEEGASGGGRSGRR